MGGLSGALQSRLAARVQPHMGGSDRGVVLTHTLAGCPPPGSATLTLLQTIMQHVPVSADRTHVLVDMVALTQAAGAENGTIRLQWDATGGGAVVALSL